MSVVSKLKGLENRLIAVVSAIRSAIGPESIYAGDLDADADAASWTARSDVARSIARNSLAFQPRQARR
jgi:hypothetical protein